MRSNLHSLPFSQRTGQAHTLAHPFTLWAVKPKHEKCRHARPPSAYRRKDVAIASQAKQGEAGNSSSMLDTIVDELRQFKSESERQHDGDQLLQALGQLDIDHYGATVATGWEGSAAWLDVEGRVQDGEMARRMAMLTVNQERVFRRSQQLTHLVSMMAKLRPGVLPPEAVLRVQNQRNKVFSSLEVLAIQHLIQISVAVLPLASVHHLLTDAISVALAQLKHLPSYQGQPGKLAKAQAKLEGDIVLWRYKVQQAVLRLHHAGNITKAGIAYQKLQDQRNAVQASEPASRSLWRSSPPSPSKPSGATPMPHSKAEEIFLLGQIQMMKIATSSWPGCGRVGWVSFGRGQCVEHTSRASTTGANSGDTIRSPSSSTDSSSKSAIGSSSSSSSSSNSSRAGEGGPFIIAEDQSSQQPGGAWVAGGLCAGALGRAESAHGGASFGAGQGDEFRAAHALLLRAQAAPASPRQLPEASRKLEAVIRANLINAIGRWADEHADAVPGVAALPEACVHSTRLRSAGDNVRTGEDVARRFTIMASGKALPKLRKQAQDRGQWLLQQLYPISNSTSLVVSDWEYNTEAPVTWNRFVRVPPGEVEEAKLTLFLDAPLSQPPQDAPGSVPPTRPSPPESHASENSARAGQQQQGATGVETSGQQEQQQQQQQGQSSPQPAPPPPASGLPRVTLYLQLDELQVFFTALLELLSAATAIAARAPAPDAQLQQGRQQPPAWLSSSRPGPWVGTPHLQVRYNPDPAGTASSASSGRTSDPSMPQSPSPAATAMAAAPSSSPSSPAAPPLLSALEISWLPAAQQPRHTWRTAPPSPTQTSPPVQQAGQLHHSQQRDGDVDNDDDDHHHQQQQQQQRVVLRLSEVHIRSLLGIYNDISSRNAELLALPPLPTRLATQVEAASQPRQPALSTAARSVQRFATAVLLLGLPVAAAAAAGVFGGGRGLSVPKAGQEGGGPVGGERQAAVVERAGSGVEQQQQQQQQQQPQNRGVKGRGGAPRCAQPVNNSVDAEAMAELCEAIKQQVHSKMWLPALKQRTPSAASSQQQQQPQSQPVGTVLRYQAVVKRSGEVVGCMPCDKTSMAWYQHMPLSAAIRSHKLQEKQQRHLEAARPDAPKPTPLASFVAPAERARFATMPSDGLVVLQVELHQQLHEAVAMSSKSSSLGAKAKATIFGGKANQGSGEGQEEVLWAPLHASVRPWCDMDSVYNMLSYDAQISGGVGSLQRAASGGAQGQGTEQQQQYEQPYEQAQEQQ